MTIKELETAFNALPDGDKEVFLARCDPRRSTPDSRVTLRRYFNPLEISGGGEPGVINPGEISVKDAFKFEVEKLRAVKDLAPLAGASIAHMAEARAAYREDARSLVTLICVFFAAFATLVYTALSRGRADGISLLLIATAMAFLVCGAFIQRAVAGKLLAAYEYYIAATIYAKLLHEAAGLGSPHQWFQRIDRLIAGLAGHGTSGPRHHAALVRAWMTAPSEITHDGARNLRVWLAAVVNASLAMLLLAFLLSAALFAVQYARQGAPDGAAAPAAAGRQ